MHLVREAIASPVIQVKITGRFLKKFILVSLKIRNKINTALNLLCPKNIGKIKTQFVIT